MAKKTIEQFEKQYGFMIEGKFDPKKQVTEEEFQKLADSHVTVGTTFGEREKWLEANGYEVNRKNMMDGSLTVKQESE